MALLQNVQVPSFYVRRPVKGPQVKSLVKTYRPAPKIKKVERQHAKNLGDVILGHPITGTKQLRHTLEDYDLDNLVYVPLLNRIVGTGLVAYERFFKPMLAGQPARAIVGTLESVGQDLDILANPVKSLFSGTGGGTLDDFLDSLGLQEHRYRKQYQWDTGNFVTDLTLEMLSDPTFVVSLLKTPARKGAQGILDEVKEHSVKVLGDSAKAIPEQVWRIGYDDMLEDLLKEDGLLLKKIKTVLEYNAESYKALQASNTLPDIISKAKSDEQLLRSALEKIEKHELDSIIRHARQSKLYKRYTTIQQFTKAADKFDTLVFRGSLAFSTLGISEIIIQKFGPLAGAISNKIIYALKDVDIHTLLDPSKKIYKELDDVLTNTLKDMQGLDYVYITNKLRKLGVNVTGLKNLYIETYYSIPIALRSNNNYVKQVFLDRLSRKAPRVSNLLNKLTDLDLNFDIVLKEYGINLKELNTYLDGISMRGQLEIDLNLQKNKLKQQIKKGNIKLHEKHPELIIQELDALGIKLQNQGASLLRRSVGTSKKGLIRDIKKIEQAIKERVKVLNIHVLEYREAKKLIRGYEYSSIPMKNSFVDHLRDVIKTEERFIAAIKEEITTLNTSLRAKRAVLAKYTSTGFSLYTLDAFLNLANELDPELYELTMAELNALGINTNNAKKIKKLYDAAKNGDKEALKQLNRRIRITKEGLNYSAKTISRASKAPAKALDFSDPAKLEFVKEQSIKYKASRHADKPTTKFKRNYYKRFINYAQDMAGQFNQRAKAFKKIQEDALKTLGNLDEAAKDWKLVCYYLSDVLHESGDEDLFTNILELLRFEATPNLASVKQLNELVDNVNRKLGVLTKNLRTPQSTLHAIGRRLNSEADFKSMAAVFTRVKQQAKDLKALLKTHLNPGKTGSLYYFRRLSDTLGTIYEVHLESYARFAAIYNTVDTLQRAKNADWWAELLNPSSQTRQNYLSIIQKFSNTDDEVYQAIANNMDSVLRTLDNTTLIIQTANEAHELAELFKFSTDLQNAFTVIFYDTLMKYKDNNIQWIFGNLGMVENFTNQFMERLQALTRISDSAIFNNNYDEIWDAVNNLYMSYFNKHAAIFQNALHKSKIGLSLTYNPSSTLGSNMNATIDYLNTLGSYQHTVAERMMTDQILTVDESASLLDFMRKTVYSKLETTRSEMQTHIQTLKALDKSGLNTNEMLDIAGDVSDSLVAEAEDGLARSLTRAYETVDAMNAELDDIIGYVAKADLDDALGKELMGINVADYITYNGYIGFHKAYDEAFATEHAIVSSWFPDLSAKTAKANEDYQKFYTDFKKAYDRISQSEFIYDKELVEYWRSELTARIKTGDLPAVPKWIDRNGQTHVYLNYFNDRSDIEILTWASLIDHRQKHTRTYIIPEKLEYYSKMQSQYKKLDDIADEIMTEPNAYNDVIFELEADQLPILDPTVSKDLVKTVKDPTTLGSYKQHLSNYVNHDVEAWNNTKKLNPYAMKLKPGDQIKGKEQRLNAFMYNITNFNTRQLGSFIADNTKGYMIINMSTPEKLVDVFKNKSTQDLVDAGLEVTFINPTTAVVVNKQALNYDKVDYVWKVPKYDEGLQTTVTQIFKDNRYYYYVDDMTVPEELWTGEMLDKEYMEYLEDSEVFSEALGDYEVRKSYLKSQDYGNEDFVTMQSPRLNFMIVGDGGAFNRVSDLVTPEFAAKNITVAHQSDNLIKSVYAGNLTAIKQANNRTKYLSLFLNDQYDLSKGVLADIFKDKTDKELQEIFTRNNWDACIIKESKSGRPKVYKIHITNQKQYAEAVKAGAIVVPHDVYRNMVLTINKGTTDTRWMKLYKRTLVFTYKYFYLNTIGTIARNGIDTTLFKNLSATGGFSSIFENFKYEARAVDLIRKHDEIQKRIAKLTADRGLLGTSREVTREVVSTLTKQQQTEYIMTDLFIRSHASAGLTKTMQDILLEYNMSGKAFDGFAFEQVWLELLNNMPVMSNLQDINSYMEQVGRFGLFLNLIEHGETATEAIRKIGNTHFDYVLKDGGTEWLEQLFWFSVFPINNFLYFVNEGINKNLDMVKYQFDMMELSWNGDEYTYEDVLKSDYLTRNLLAGNIRIKIGDKNFVIKKGSSLFDFLNIVINPVAQPADRLNPFLSVLLGLEDTSQLNPLSGMISRAEQIKEGKSLIPSLYTELYPKREYKKPAYASYVKTWRSYPRRARRMYNKYANPNYNFRTYRYNPMRRTSRWKKWLESPHFVDYSWNDFNNNRYQKGMRDYFQGSKYLRHKI